LATAQTISPVEISEPYDAQKHTVIHLANRPSSNIPSDEELDDLVNGLSDSEIETDLAGYISDLEAYNWFEDFLPALNWWTILSDFPFYGANSPGLAKRDGELSQLLTDVMVAFQPAHKEARSYADHWPGLGVNIVNLLKKYRLYTRCVSALIRETWPDLNVWTLRVL
jgi:hypothetical protein